MMNHSETLLQLGGRQALMMIGGSVVTADNRLTVKIKAAARDKIKAIVIILDEGSDTYIVEFWAGRGASMRIVDTTEMVYADTLRTTIEARTGLYLSLGTMGRR